MKQDDEVQTVQTQSVPNWPSWLAAAFLAAWQLDTMSRGLRWFDTAEFALVGAQFGLGHPPGQPLYTMILGVLAHIPGLDPLLAMNGFSAICAGLCALPADRLIRRVCPALPWTRFIALLAVGCLFPLWDQGTRIELYAPSTLISLVIIAWGASLIDEQSFSTRSWAGLGVSLGALAGFNIIFAIGAALAVASQAILTLGKEQITKTIKPILATIAGGLVGCTHYLYLFWVRAKTDAMVWGELDTSEGIFAYLTGADYGHTAHTAIASVPANLWSWFSWFGDGGGWLMLLAGAVGIHSSDWVRQRVFLWIVPTLTGISFTFTYGVFFPEVPDYSGYLAPGLWWLAPGIAALLTNRLPRYRVPGLAVIAGWSILFGPVEVSKHRARDNLSSELAGTWLDSMPERGILIVESDHLVFPMMYLQAVEKRRPDVVLINAGFGASAWYWRYIMRSHPDLADFQLAAPTTGHRLRNFILAHRDRTPRVESIGLASSMGVRPCLDTWGFTLGPACQTVEDRPDVFEEQLATWWVGPPGQESMSLRVLSWLARKRAVGQWALGDASGALRTLVKAGPVWQKDHLPQPKDLTVPPGTSLPREAPVLIGNPWSNLRLGVSMLEVMGHPAAQDWQRVLEAY